MASHDLSGGTTMHIVESENISELSGGAQQPLETQPASSLPRLLAQPIRRVIPKIKATQEGG